MDDDVRVYVIKYVNTLSVAPHEDYDKIVRRKKSGVLMGARRHGYIHMAD